MLKRNNILEILVVVLILGLGISGAVALTTPYSLSGHVYDSTSNPVVGASITFTNLNSSDVIYYTSTSGGEYQQDAANFASGYFNNDNIQYVCTYSGATNTSTAVIDTSGGGTVHDIYLSAASLDIDNLTAEVGSTYIKWSWDYCNATTGARVYIDGTLVTNTSLNYYILSDLNPREKHTLSLSNTTGGFFVTNTARTFYPSIIFYIVFLLAMILLIAEIFLKEIISVFAGVLAFVLSLFAFYLSFPFYFSLLSYLCVAMAAIAMIWLILTIITLLTKSLDDLEEF